MKYLLLALVVTACGSAAAPAPSREWTTPAGWKSETIPFPLGFAPDVAHTGVEEIRFSPGWSKSGASDFWSYAFIWRTTDAASLDATELSDELTRYFRGLVAAVDGGKRKLDLALVTARAVAAGDQFQLVVHLFNAFGDGEPIDLVGWAKRTSCGTGALWTFALAPPTSGIRTELDELARSARCR